MPGHHRPPPTVGRPPPYKQAIVTWMGAYPVITLILALLGPPTATWPLPVRTLVISILMVVALNWVVLPFLTRIFRGWLFASSRDAPEPADPR